VRRALAERQVMLAGVAVLGIAVSLAFTTRQDHEKAVAALPVAVGSYSALAAATAPVSATDPACGVEITPTVVGIFSPVLPCGVRLYMTRGSRHVLAPVVGRSPIAQGAEFGLTAALAHRLGINGVKRIRWSYAASR
jgi:hypothetical protein